MTADISIRTETHDLQGRRRLADSNCWTVPPAPNAEKTLQIGGFSCLEPLRGKGPTAYVVTPGPLESPCWMWQGSLNSRGYPIRGTQGGGLYLVHRRVLEERDGSPLPTGVQSHHRCEVKACVNPWHLERMTTLQHGRLHGAHGKRPLAELAFEVLEQGGSHHVRDIAETIGARQSSVAVALHRAADRGEVVRVGRGVFASAVRAAA